MFEVVCKSAFGDEYSLWFDHIPSDDEIIAELYSEWDYFRSPNSDCDEWED